MRRRLRIIGVSGVLTGLVAACRSDAAPQADGWQVVHSGLPGALLSVWGSHADDVWAVGADRRDGSGPTVIHFDGESWSHLPTGLEQGNLWWVFGFAEGPVYMGGEGGLILRYVDGEYEVMDTPGTGTVFGIWGANPGDLWAVGGNSDATGGFAWRLADDAWVPEPALPAEVESGAALWKIFGTATDEAWLVGSNGVALHWNGMTLQAGQTGVGTSLFTVHAREGRYAAVGGTASGIIVEYEAGEWSLATPDPAPSGLSGVALGEDGSGIAVGSFGAVYSRSDAEGWVEEPLDFNLSHSLHGVWIDDRGGAWAAGGQIFTPPFDEGLLLHRGSAIPSEGL